MTRKRQARRSGPPLVLLDPEDVRVVLRHRLQSRDWWTFLTVDATSTDFMGRIERRHFIGKRSKDFELLMIPASDVGLGIVGIFFARKSRLPAWQLSRHLDDAGMPHAAEEIARRGLDILALTPGAAAGMKALALLRQLASEMTSV
jgi:hypothetical protein